MAVQGVGGTAHPKRALVVKAEHIVLWLACAALGAGAASLIAMGGLPAPPPTSGMAVGVTATPTSAACGNGVCNDGEGFSCPGDCGPGHAQCGNAICEENKGESYNNCPQDCQCGDGYCDAAQESKLDCPVDCFGGVCGDGVCEPQKGETAGSCGKDCSCGDGVCDPQYEFNSQTNTITCPADCICNNDNECDPGEINATCGDCHCGNGLCELNRGENHDTCGVDCGCNNDGVCEADIGEMPQTCPNDCVCNNSGVCDPGETHDSCPADCTCGDNVCNNGETYATCPNDCSCGNGACNANEGETYATCPQDCPCGDGLCNTVTGEDHVTCEVDCNHCPEGAVYSPTAGACATCAGGEVYVLQAGCPSPTDVQFSNPAWCGYGGCELDEGETVANCPGDCGECGDNICSPGRGEDSYSCSDDCLVCGDNVCSPQENFLFCPQDCKGPVGLHDGAVTVNDDPYSRRAVTLGGLEVISLLPVSALWFLRRRTPLDLGRRRRAWQGLGLSGLTLAITVLGLLNLPGPRRSAPSALELDGPTPTAEQSAGDGVCGSPCQSDGDCQAGFICLPGNECWQQACDQQEGEPSFTPAPAVGCGSACTSDAQCAGLGPNPTCAGGACYDAQTCGGGSSDSGGDGSGGGDPCASITCGDDLCQSACGEDANNCAVDCHR